MNPLVLRPFSISAVSELRCEVRAHRDNRRFQFEFLWHDPKGGLDLLGAKLDVQRTLGPEARRKNLWEATCFEAFVHPVGSDAYWELNVTPTGAWNLYHFSAERRGMAEAELANELVFATRKLAAGFSVQVEFELPGLDGLETRIGIASVVQLRDGTIEYWSLAHTRPEPDFHAPDSFLLLL